MGEYEYKNKVLSRIHNTEGSCVRQSNGAFTYEYSLKDHLGNTRVTFSDTNGDWNIDPNTEVSQINHYYPFGLNMEGNWNGQNGANKTQYNGKEWNDDFGLGWNDYGARFYDPAMARWVAVDPLAEKFNHWSPYNYGMDSPIVNIDPDGRSAMPGQDTNESSNYNNRLSVVEMVNRAWNSTAAGTNSSFSTNTENSNEQGSNGDPFKEYAQELVKRGAPSDTELGTETDGNTSDYSSPFVPTSSKFDSKGFVKAVKKSGLMTKDRWGLELSTISIWLYPIFGDGKTDNNTLSELKTAGDSFTKENKSKKGFGTLLDYAKMAKIYGEIVNSLNKAGLKTGNGYKGTIKVNIWIQPDSFKDSSDLLQFRPNKILFMKPRV